MSEKDQVSLNYKGQPPCSHSGGLGGVPAVILDQMAVGLSDGHEDPAGRDAEAAASSENAPRSLRHLYAGQDSFWTHVADCWCTSSQITAGWSPPPQT